MKKETIRNAALLLALTQSLTLAGCNTANNMSYMINDNPTHISGSVLDDYVLEGYHREGKNKMVKNPGSLVDALYVPEEGYHLEQYEYDNNLFYVIEDGYHNEDGYLVKDGYHLEGFKIIKDISLSKKINYN